MLKKLFKALLYTVIVVAVIGVGACVVREIGFALGHDKFMNVIKTVGCLTAGVMYFLG